VLHIEHMDWKGFNTGFIAERVHDHYWNHDDTCAYTTLSILSRLFGAPLESQVLNASLGMWGAGVHRAQCGLVEGALMFIGILGVRRGLDRDRISRLCRSYAQAFEERFGSLTCRELRPEGFSPDNPPHICEELSDRAVTLATGFIADAMAVAPGMNPGGN
jgi:hypothetical protein